MKTKLSSSPSANSDTAGVVSAWLVETAIAVAALGVLLFVAAGRLDWANGWLYLAMVAATQVVNAAVLIPNHSDLVVERMQLQPGTKHWDKLLAPLINLAPIAICIVGGLDLRFGWTPAVPAAVVAAGMLLAAAGFGLSVWAMLVNRFFSSTVRIQTERGHKTVETGPYRFVRHPGYLGFITLDLGTPLILGSLAAFFPAVLACILIVTRTSLEDRTLIAELDGYREYAQRVRNRLIPGIW